MARIQTSIHKHLTTSRHENRQIIFPSAKVQLWHKCPVYSRVMRSVHIRSAATCEIHHVTTQCACASVSNVHLHCNMFILVGCCMLSPVLGHDVEVSILGVSSMKSNNLDKWIVLDARSAVNRCTSRNPVWQKRWLSVLLISIHLSLFKTKKASIA